MGDLTRIVCIVVLEAGRSKTKMPTDLAPGEDPTSSFRKRPSCCVLTGWRGKELVPSFL